MTHWSLTTPVADKILAWLRTNAAPTATPTSRSPTSDFARNAGPPEHDPSVDLPADSIHRRPSFKIASPTNDRSLAAFLDLMARAFTTIREKGLTPDSPT